MGQYLKNRSIVILAALFLIWIALQQVNTAGGVEGAWARLLQLAMYTLPSFLIAIVLHEWAHAYSAWRLGDPTARMLGRLTLNPLKHLDPLGTVMMIVAGFGWAKPVPINPANFRHPKRDMAISAGAGPAMNLALAVLCVAAINLWIPAYLRDPVTIKVQAGFSVFRFLLEMAMLNALLCVFNLLPIHPLDGHHFLQVLLSPRDFYTYKQNEGLISLIGLVLLLNGFFEPLLRGVQVQVMKLCMTSYWGV